MQYPNDAPLDAAIRTERRVLRPLLELDWNRDGTYVHGYGDLSGCVQSAVISRDLTGDLPAELSVVEGFQTSQVQITIGGWRDGDPMPIARMFSPYQARSPLFGVPKKGMRMRYSIVVETEDGPRTIRQFTGVLLEVTAKPHTGEVELTGVDASEYLSADVEMAPWAVPAPARSLYGEDALTVNTQHVLDMVLRKAGVYLSPPPHRLAFCSATLHGGIAPEIGQMLAANIPQIVNPSITPRFTQGPFGLLAMTGSGTQRSEWSVRSLVEIGFPVGGSIAVSCWMLTPVSNDVVGDNPTFPVTVTMDGGLGSFRLGYASGGLVFARLTGSNGYDWTQYGPTIPSSPGWRYIGAAVTRLTSGGDIRFSFNINGVVTTVDVTGSYPDFGAFTGILDVTRIIVETPLSDVQAWRVSAGAIGWPSTISASVNEASPPAVLDRGLGHLSRIISTRGPAKAFDVLRAYSSSEYGVLWVDEFGTIRFINRSTLRAEQDTIEVDVDPSVLTDTSITETMDGVRNVISYTTTASAAYPDTCVFSSSAPELFDSYPGVTTFLVGLPDAQSVDYGGLPFLGSASDIPDELHEPAGYVAVNATTGLVIDGALIIPYVFQIDASTVAVQITNNSPHLARFQDASGSPCLRISGTLIRQDSPMTEQVTDTASITRYYGHRRVLDLPTSDYRQNRGQMRPVAQSLIADTAEPPPVLERLPMRGDPRTQVTDNIAVRDVDGLGGRMLGTIVGITRTHEVDTGLTDEITTRLFHPPNRWVLGDPSLSVLGRSTVLHPVL